MVELCVGVNGGGGIVLSGILVFILLLVQNSIFGSVDEMLVSSGGSVDVVYIFVILEQIVYIKLMIVMCNGSQSNVILYVSLCSVQGIVGLDFCLEMEGLQYSEILMLVGSNLLLMQ